MRLRTLASIAAALLLPVLLSSPASAYDMGAPDTPVRLSAGLSHTAFVDQEGVLWTWGSNQSGQLGAETQETGTDLEGTVIPLSSRPLQVMEDVASVSAGADFTVALKTDGTLWAWGGNDYGQLGNGCQGNTTDQTGAQLQTLPLSLSTTGPVTAVSAGTSHTAVILADGSLWTWGRNDTQQLGLDQTAPTVSLPAQVPAVTQAAAVGTGTYQTVCLLSDDTLFSWGPQAMGLLGGGAVETLAEVPKAEAAAPAEATQVTFQEETAAWVPLAILAGSAILLVLAGCLSRKERVGV